MPEPRRGAARRDEAASPPGERASLTDQAYRAVKASILRGAIAPNALIDEPEMARGLSMSRTPVREALLRLRDEGLVEMRRGRGIRVVPLSSADMHELYQLITGLESHAAFLLAGRRPSRAELAPLLACVADLSRHRKAGDEEAWGEADERFHRTLLVACGNERLARLGLHYRDVTQRAHLVAARLQQPSYKGKSVAEHRRLVTTIRAGDAEGARAQHLAQRLRGEAALLSALDAFGLSSL